MARGTACRPTPPIRETAASSAGLRVVSCPSIASASRHSRFAASSRIAGWRTTNLPGFRGRQQPVQSRRAPWSSPGVPATWSATHVRRRRDPAHTGARRDRARAAPPPPEARSSRVRGAQCRWTLSRSPSRRAWRLSMTRACTTTSTANADHRRGAPGGDDVLVGGPFPTRKARRRRESWRAAAATRRRRGRRPRRAGPSTSRSASRYQSDEVMRDASRRCSGASSRA